MAEFDSGEIPVNKRQRTNPIHDFSSMYDTPAEYTPDNLLPMVMGAHSVHSEDEDDMDKMKDALATLTNKFGMNGEITGSATSKLQYICVRQYLELRISGHAKMEASQIVAERIYNKKNANSYKSKCIREWAACFVTSGCITESRQGKHVKTSTIMTDPTVQQLFRNLLTNMPLEKRIPRNFAEVLNDDILRSIPNSPPTVSIETARRWMKYLGFAPNGQKMWLSKDELQTVIESQNSL